MIGRNKEQKKSPERLGYLALLVRIGLLFNLSVLFRNSERNFFTLDNQEMTAIK